MPQEQNGFDVYAEALSFHAHSLALLGRLPACDATAAALENVAGLLRTIASHLDDIVAKARAPKSRA